MPSGCQCQTILHIACCDACVPDIAFLKFSAEPLQSRIGHLGCVRLERAFQLGVLLPLLVRLQASRRGSHVA